MTKGGPVIIRIFGVVLLAFGTLLVISAAPAAAEEGEAQPSGVATLKADHVGATNPGFQTGECPENTLNDNTFGWHFVFQGDDTEFVTLSATFQSAGTISEFISHPTAKHAFVFTPTGDKLLSATATTNEGGTDTEFNLSHVCEGEEPEEEQNPELEAAAVECPESESESGVLITVTNNGNAAGVFQIDGGSNIPVGANSSVSEFVPKAEDAAYSIKVTGDGDLDETFSGTLDCEEELVGPEVQPEVSPNDEVKDVAVAKVAKPTTTTTAAPTQVLGETLPRTGTNTTVAVVGFATLMAGALALTRSHQLEWLVASSRARHLRR